MSFQSCSKAAFRLARRSLFTAAFAALAVLGSQSATQGAAIVFLEQVGGPAQSTPGQQTIVEAEIKAYITSPTTSFSARGWQAGNINWTLASGDPGATVADLYTISYADATPAPVSGGANTAAPIDANTVGYLFATTSLPTMSYVSDSSRFMSITQFSGATFNATQASPVTLATVRFAISSGISQATFNLTIDDGVNSYFVPSSGGNVFTQYQTPTGAGTLQVVPEPSTMYSLFAVGLVTTGIQVRRLRRRQAA